MAKDGKPRTLPTRTGTEVEMDISDSKVVIEDRHDAQALVAILARSGVKVNLRNVTLES